MNNIVAFMAGNKMCHILEKPLTTTKILSLPLLVLDNSKTKSIDVLAQRIEGTNHVGSTMT